MGFLRAAQFQQHRLKKSLSMLLDAEFKIKGSLVPLRIVLEELIISLIKANRPAQA
jgi:DNA polymerase III delta subunit